MNAPKNKVELRQLTEDEGGGWLVTFPDLPGCTTTGDTEDEAVSWGGPPPISERCCAAWPAR